jgi:hypothetical protein
MHEPALRPALQIDAVAVKLIWLIARMTRSEILDLYEVKCLTADPELRSLLYPTRARRGRGKKNCRSGILMNGFRIPSHT